MKNFKLPLEGIVPPLVTPLNRDLSLDLKGLHNLLEHVIRGGVHGVFILGTTGESVNLSYAKRRELIRETCMIINGRVPVVVGITDTSLEESIALSDYSGECGVSAVVATPPYYYALGQPELVDYYRQLADNIDLPLFLYNMPSHTKVNIQASTVMALVDHPNIIGLKDSSANGGYFQTLCYLLRNKKDFTLLMGPEEMMAETVLLGGHGGVNGGANMFPELYVALYRAAKSGDLKKVRSLQQKVMRISTGLYGLGLYSSGYLKGVKCALSIMGICQEYMTAPFEPFAEKERNIIRERLEQISK